MKDEQMLDVITDAFVKELIKNKMANRQSYMALLKRIVCLIRIELNWQERKDWEKEMMSSWGPSCN
jgi:argonaute-like protein implicated in RNA metabolism and viral defense